MQEKKIYNKRIYPTLSVVVPIYNSDKYLGKCVDSIISQNFDDIELILIDDGSTDKSAEICDEYAKKDARIKVIHKSNGGVNTARNVGLEIATGEYITFVDSDDVIIPDTFALNMQILRENENIHILQYPEIGVHGNEEQLWHGYPQMQTIIEGYNNMILALLGDNAVIPGGLWGKIYRRSIWKNLRLRTDLHFCEDMIMMPEIFKNANNILLSTVGAYRYIWNDDSACHSEYTQAKCMDVARSAYGFYEICLKYEISVLKYWNNAVKACINAWSYCGPNRELKGYLQELKKNKEGMSSKMPAHRMIKLARVFSPLQAAKIKWLLVRLFHLNKV